MDFPLPLTLVLMMEDERARGAVTPVVLAARQAGSERARNEEAPAPPHSSGVFGVPVETRSTRTPAQPKSQVS
jgi:hypothetical protein